jgi:hypothetical protein
MISKRKIKAKIKRSRTFTYKMILRISCSKYFEIKVNRKKNKNKL